MGNEWEQKTKKSVFGKSHPSWKKWNHKWKIIIDTYIINLYCRLTHQGWLYYLKYTDLKVTWVILKEAVYLWELQSGHTKSQNFRQSQQIISEPPWVSWAFRPEVESQKIKFIKYVPKHKNRIFASSKIFHVNANVNSQETVILSKVIL